MALKIAEAIGIYVLWAVSIWLLIIAATDEYDQQSLWAWCAVAIGWPVLGPIFLTIKTVKRMAIELKRILQKMSVTGRL